MKSTTKTSSLILLVCCLVMSLVFCGCDNGREYYEDICIKSETSHWEIIIKEWSFLLGSGAEVYCKNNNDEILLGQLAGGDDGFCPFKEGLYSVSFDSNKVTIKWCVFPSEQEKPWNTKTFTLPSDKG